MMKSGTAAFLTGIALVMANIAVPARISVKSADEPEVDGKFPPGSRYGPYRGFGYSWENNNLGIDRNVPKPWTAIRFDGKVASIWGRELDFSQSILPRQITSQNATLLSGPMKLLVRCNGQTLSESGVSPAIVEQAPDRIRLQSTLSGDRASVLVDTSLEFDGFLEVEFTITPTKEVATIEQIALEIPYKQEVAKYFSRALDYDFVKQKVDKASVINRGGRIDGPMTMPFQHNLWVGNRKVGCEVTFETNNNWSPLGPEGKFELQPDGRTVLLRVNIVSKSLEIGIPTVYRFALCANPIKPMAANWRTRIPTSALEGASYDRPAGYDAKLWRFSTARIGPGGKSFALKYPGLSDPPTEPSQRALYDIVRKKLAANRIDYIPYAALTEVHADVPELRDYAPFWLLDPSDKGKRPEPWKRAQKSRLAPDKPGAAFGISLYPKSVQDFFIADAVRSIQQWHQNGIFFDLAHKVQSVRNPKAAEIDIRATAIAYNPIFEAREFRKRLYKATKSLNPEYQITQHGMTPISLCGFADINYSGEAFNRLFYDAGRDALKRKALPPGHPPYLPDYSLLPDDFWMAVYHQSVGSAHYLFPQIIKWSEKGGGRFDREFDRKWIKNHAKELAHYTRTMLSRTVPLDVPVWRTRMDLDMYDKLMVGFEKFGGLADPLIFIGPEDEDRIRSSPGAARIVTSAYLRPDQKKMILIIANWSAQSQTDKCRINFSALNAEISKISRMIDLEGHPLPSFDERSITVELPGNDFRVWMIE